MAELYSMGIVVHNQKIVRFYQSFPYTLPDKPASWKDGIHLPDGKRQWLRDKGDASTVTCSSSDMQRQSS